LDKFIAYILTDSDERERNNHEEYDQSRYERKPTVEEQQPSVFDGHLNTPYDSSDYGITSIMYPSVAVKSNETGCDINCCD
jgi:hypothetical protein